MSDMRELAVGEALRRVSTWVWKNGGPEAMLTFASEHPDPDVEIANLIDGLSAYVHGQYLEWYGHGKRDILDDCGHPVTRE